MYHTRTKSWAEKERRKANGGPRRTRLTLDRPCSSSLEVHVEMDSSYAQHPQSMGQSSFFYYSPDSKADNRQHGHFSQQPNNIQVPVYHSNMTPMPSTPMYSRPNSACSQPAMHPQMYNNAYAVNMTPVASPRPVYQTPKPMIMVQDHAPRMMLESEVHDEMYYLPSTPPMSASGSSFSSPAGCDLVSAPMNPVFFGLDGFEGVKAGCQSDVQAENLAGGEWSRCGSPPMTPGTCFVFPRRESAASSRGVFVLVQAAKCLLFCTPWFRGLEHSFRVGGCSRVGGSM